MEVKLHVFLASALDGDEWSTPRHGPFTPKDIAPVPTEWKGWVGFISGLNVVVRIEPRLSSP